MRYLKEAYRDYWETCSEAVNVIKAILKVYKIPHETWDATYGENWSLDDINDEEYRYRFDNIEYEKGKYLSIIVIAPENIDIESDMCYDGTLCTVYLYDDDPSTDGTLIDSGKQLMKELNRYGLDLKKTMMKMNEMKYLESYKLFERNNKFVNSKSFDLEKWYDKINKHFWNGKLPKVELRWNNAKTELGVLKWDEKSKKIDHLGISDEFKLTQEELLSVLAHEMIHVWQVVNNKTDGHGKNFIKEMERLNKKSKWGIKILPKQPMDHLKMTNPDLKSDYGFILVKNKKDDFDIIVYDPNKTDHKNLIEIIRQNLKKNSKVDVEVRLTQNGVVKKYEKESTNTTLNSYKIDELTFNTLMNDSKKIYGGTIK